MVSISKVSLLLSLLLFSLSCIHDDGVAPGTVETTAAASELKLWTGNSWACASTDDGTKCWGSGQYIGQGNTESVGDDELPSSVPVIADFGYASLVPQSGGNGNIDDHTCAADSAGDLYCWGSGGNGQLGYGNTDFIGNDEAVKSVSPVSVGGTPIYIATGYAITCVVLSDGSVKCWGENDNGQLGQGDTSNRGDNELPSSYSSISLGSTAIAVSAGRDFSCAILTGGDVKCWGLSDRGQLGQGNTTTIGDDEAPSTVSAITLGGSATKITSGSSHTCALLSTGAVRCWGDGSSGQLGYGNTNNIGDDETPSSAGDVSIGGTAIDVCAGSVHSCALLSDGNIRCWGASISGSLGSGNSTDIGDDELPSSVSVVDLGDTATSISCLSFGVCTTLGSGGVKCWGSGFSGVVGQGDTNTIGDNESPSTVGAISIF